jgi:hypothetical protein
MLDFMSDSESYLHPICMKTDGESDRESDGGNVRVDGPLRRRGGCLHESAGAWTAFLSVPSSNPGQPFTGPLLEPCVWGYEVGAWGYELGAWGYEVGACVHLGRRGRKHRMEVIPPSLCKISQIDFKKC